MSSGATHDKVTFLLTPIIATVAWFFIGYYALLLALMFLFSGLMFNGDLDIKSQVYNRWLFLKWFWIPYQSFGHRSKWTHGPVLGTITRLLWVGIPTTLILYFTGNIQLIIPFIDKYYYECCISFIGLELGNISHTFMDWLSTGFKKLFT